MLACCNSGAMLENQASAGSYGEDKKKYRRSQTKGRLSLDPVEDQ